MRIAMIGQKGIPAHSGGVEQHVDVLSRLLTERGHQVSVYCRRSYCGRPPADDSPVWPRRLFCPSVPTKHLDAITHTAAATLDVLFRHVDLVHYHAIGPAALAPMARLAGLPAVVTVHGLDWQRAKWGRFARRCLRFGERTAARWASRLVVVSEPLREHFASAYGVASRFIPNGVVPPPFRPAERIQRWNLQSRGYVLAVARLVPEKGLHHLIEAFAGLASELKLVIAGSGGLDSGYEARLRKAAGPHVVFTGNADRELVAELYSHALLFVLPSEIEGMSIALLEAMSSGLPVLVSDIPENACVVRDAGFTFRDRDAGDLRRALAAALAAPGALAERGRRARVEAGRYRWSRVATDLEEVYRSAVSGAGRDPAPSEPRGLARESAGTPAMAGPIR